MRGDENIHDDVWSYIPLEQRVPADHPLRPMRTMVPAMWANHHAWRPAGGRTSFTMSSPARIVPSAPKTTGTMPSRSQLGPGRTSPNTISAALTAIVTSAAVQSSAPAP